MSIEDRVALVTSSKIRAWLNEYQFNGRADRVHGYRRSGNELRSRDVEILLDALDRHMLADGVGDVTEMEENLE